MEKSKQFYERYQRQLLLPGLGYEGQQQLQNARVLVMGAGGLGCPVLQYLAAAGVGTLGIVDFDTVDLSNLHRQLLYNTNDIGKLKVECAKDALLKQNPLTHINIYPVRLSNQNILEIIETYDLVIDGTDNFATRYLISDASEILDKPLIYGAVSRFEGQVAVFNVRDNDNNKTSYRDLFPVPPKENEIPNCAEGGVLGVLPGIIGTLQATEAIKLITGIGHPLVNQLMIYRALDSQFYTISITPDPLRLPVSKALFYATDYIQLCTAQNGFTDEISKEDLHQMLPDNNILLIDVREYGEMPPIEGYNFVRIPLSELRQNPQLPAAQETIITICQSGNRSLIAAEILKKHFTSKNIYSLRGGVNEL